MNTKKSCVNEPIRLTEEQKVIIQSSGNKTINAVAGSGKTTTVVEYAASRPPGSKILYLAFNKSVKLEAIRKFEDRGLSNVTVETAHSLAYRHIIRGNNYRIRAQGYKTHEIAELLGLQGDGQKHTEYIIANHINKFITYFCNSDKQKVQDLNYGDTVSDPKAKTFVRTFYRHIEDGTRLLLAKMDKAEIEITHDFYLKKFQLSAPALSFDYILFDEGQDASQAMLDVFLKQNAVKIIVGDVHQQIYGWRYAVNSLTQINFQTLNLSMSFRFPQDIADLAASILSWKKLIIDFSPVRIRGMAQTVETGNKINVQSDNSPAAAQVARPVSATLARSNLALLLNAINYITNNPGIRHIYFEGNINSYTYADDGASLYDVLNLYNDNHNRVRDKLIASMKNMFELEEYIKSTEDAQLGMMVEIVNEYGNEIPSIIKSLKDLHTGDGERDKAEMIFSTVHRAKGMEYDTVYLVNDFITEQKLERITGDITGKNKKEKQDFDKNKLNEEINLLYVAVTRAKSNLHIPESMIPKDFPPSRHIRVIADKKKEAQGRYGYDTGSKYSGLRSLPRNPTGMQIKEEAYSVERKREINKDAYRPWTAELDEKLISLSEAGKSLTEIALYFGRTKGAIMSRLRKLDSFPD